METTGVTCPRCGAGFRRVELWSQPGEKGEYRCPVCATALEVFDGTKLIAYRLTIEPSPLTHADVRCPTALIWYKVPQRRRHMARTGKQ